jgi:Family of unknown function (DUF6677)
MSDNSFKLMKPLKSRFSPSFNNERDSRVQLKSPMTAVMLAILFPGAGHWYQGRRFKATIFTVCIMTVFIWGMILGNWQPVYSQSALPTRQNEGVQLERSAPRTEYSFGFIAQVMMGGPVLPALIQQERFRTDTGRVDRLDSPMDSEFHGILSLHDDEVSPRSGIITGTVQLKPANPAGGRVVTGELSGTLDDGSEVRLPLGGEIQLGRSVFGSPWRDVQCEVRSPDDGRMIIGTLQGSVQRSFLNWFMAPRDDEEMDRLHGKLNARFDIASVFTWIAGLLNLMVIWDAADGPAYGYGDEEAEKKKKK